jgi:phosphoribosylformylglycinamidine (FGAM) synthase-like enzyme
MQNQTVQKTSVLLNALHQFGLNPREWTIAESQERMDRQFLSMRLLVNKQDPEFRLLGYATPKGWKRLQLLSV